MPAWAPSSGWRRVPSSGGTHSSKPTPPSPFGASGPSLSAPPNTSPIYGGEAVRLDGDVVSRLRSVAYGPTVERTIGYAYLPAATPEGAALEIDVFDRRVGAVVGPDVTVDPPGDRMRG